MSNWKDKTDFEINRAVATARGIKTMHKDGVSKFKDSPSGFMIVTREPLQHYPFDPVNNPCHAWPIIVENEISLLRDTSTNDVWEAICKGWHTVSGFQSRVSLQGHCIDKNPLRAAMIVYLEMNGVKQ